MTTAHIAGSYEVAIDGRPYRVMQEQHVRRFLDVIRQQADSSAEPSERTLNPSDLWRRSQDDWVFGQGQTLYDDDESVKKRYRVGSGVDPFSVKGKMRMANGVTQVDTGHAFTDIGKAVVANGFLWVMRPGEKVLSRWDGAAWSDTVDALAVGQVIEDITTDGINLYVASRDSGATAGGVYLIAAGSLTPVLLNELIPDKVAYVRGRLMVAAGPSLYNITDVGSTTAPDPLTASVVNSTFTWDAFGQGLSYIYASGHAGDQSLIYRISIREDGTALTPPVAAAQMPDGENVTSIIFYLGVLVLGTTKGVRIGVSNGGAVQFGPLIEETNGPVLSLEPQDRYVWYGVEGGVNRLDLSRFIPGFDLLPAYASDLTVGTGDPVVTVLTWENKRLFTTINGVFLEDPTSVTGQTSSFSTGLVSYAMTDQKNVMFLDVVVGFEHASDILGYVVKDQDGVVISSGSIVSTETMPFTVSVDALVESCEVTFTFISGSGMTSPVLSRFTLRALPAPKRTEQIVLPLDIRSSTETMSRGVVSYDFWGEVAALQDMARSGRTVEYQEFGNTYSASVENVQVGPELDVDMRNQAWEGPVQVTLRVYDS